VVGDERHHVAAGQVLDVADELIAHRFLERVAGFLDDLLRCNSIIIFSTSV
jgi:hypothetical protein